ncbi:MAG: hypothetical protein ACE5GA_01665 [Candidatus Zixiibacteriota bacterium]
MNSARARGLGEAIIQSSPTATDILLAPSLRADDRTLYFEAGVARRFDLSELDVGYVAAVYRSGALTYGLGLQQFGQSDLYAEKTVRALGAYQRGGVSAGVSVSGKSLEFGGGYGSLSAVSLGLAAGYHERRLLIDVTLDEINRPQLSSGAPREPLAGTVYAELLGSSSFTLSGRARFQERAKPSLGVGQSLSLSEYGRLSWGLKSEPLEYGAGFEFRKGKYALHYTGSFHPALGYSQNASLVINFTSSTKQK